jgi:hypothetical protein
MRRIVIELKKHSKVSLTPVQGERLDYALRRFANHLRGLEPKQVLLQDYDPRVSSKYRYTPAPQLLKVLRKALSDDLLNGHGAEGEKVNGWKVRGYQPSAVSHRLELKNARRKAVASAAALVEGVGHAKGPKAKDTQAEKPAELGRKKPRVAKPDKLPAIQQSRGSKPVRQSREAKPDAVNKPRLAKVAAQVKPTTKAKPAKRVETKPVGRVKAAKSHKPVKALAASAKTAPARVLKPTKASKPKAVVAKSTKSAKPKPVLKSRSPSPKKPDHKMPKRQAPASPKTKATRVKSVVKATVGKAKGKTQNVKDTKKKARG